MKLLQFWPFGRPRTHDDLKALQDQIATIEESFAGSGAFIWKGCEVSPNGTKFNVSAGLVHIDGKLMRFDGAVNVDLPIELVSAVPVQSDVRNDSGGAAHNAMIEYKATWQPWSGDEEDGGGEVI
jgi:hypothetical protein